MWHIQVDYVILCVVPCCQKNGIDVTHVPSADTECLGVVLEEDLARNSVCIVCLVLWRLAFGDSVLRCSASGGGDKNIKWIRCLDCKVPSPLHVIKIQACQLHYARDRASLSIHHRIKDVMPFGCPQRNGCHIQERQQASKLGRTRTIPTR
jgi:hypothetical protein